MRKTLAKMCAALLAAAGLAGSVAAQERSSIKDTCTPETVAAQVNNPDAAPRKGEGAPVVVVPGFLTSDEYMEGLHKTLRQSGYSVYGWGAGFNLGANADQAAALEKRLQDVFELHAQQKVSLVGYSLGGIYARELARKRPDMVDRVITLSAPFGLDDKRVHAIAGFYGQNKDRMTEAPPVPTTAIYSGNDWVVSAASAVNKGDMTRAENIPVESGHLTMPFNATVGRVIVYRLGTVTAQWTPLCR